MSPPREKRNAKTQRSVATRKSSGRLTRYTIQKLPVIWFPNDWTATSPRSSRYRNRWETRNGGGAGGAETIRAAPTHPRVQRDFAPSSAFHGRPRSLAIDSATRAVRRRAEGHHVPATIDSSKSIISHTLSTLSRAEDAVMPTRMENAQGAITENNASSVQSSPAARMKSHGSRARRVAK